MGRIALADTAPTQNAAAQPTVPATTEPGSGLIDDSDPAWIWSGMETYTDPNLHGGAGHAGGPGTSATYSFHGTAVDVIGLAGPSILVDGRPHVMGTAVVTIDGKTVSTTLMLESDVVYAASMAHVAGLPDGNHVLRIEARDGWIVVDYIKATLTQGGSVAGSCMLVNAQTGLAAGITIGSTSAGHLVQASIRAGAQQLWALQPAVDGYYTLKNESTGLYLASHLDQNVTWAVLAGPTGGAEQEWRVDSAGQNLCTLTNRASGYCLNVFNQSTSAGSWLNLDTAHPGDNFELWSMRPVAGP
jgi:hypothetical protein